jgi:nucleotide-binding universal stress UspA family protein
VQGEALLDFLVELAQEAGIRVRVIPRSAEELHPAPRSGVCRIRGSPWLLLASGEPLEDRIEAAAMAVRTHAPEALEGRYLPPAVRERLDSPRGKTG